MPGTSESKPAPFYLPGGATGALLIHGFTGSPLEMRLIGDYLNEQGITVSAPLLPGHGTTAQQLNRCRWQDWTDHAEGAYAALRERCQVVFVGGLSMGSLITVLLAAQHPVAGAVLYSPAFKVANPLIHLAPLLKYLVPKKNKSGESDLTDPEAEQRKWSYDAFPSYAAHELLKLTRVSRGLLPRLDSPLLIIHSTGDTAIRSDSAQFAYDLAGSENKELVTLHNSGHVLTVDSEWETVAKRTYDFMRAWMPAAVG